MLISRSSTKAPLAAAGKPGPGLGSHPHPPKELGIFHCPRQMPAQLLHWSDDSARQHGLMRFDQGIETPWSLVSFFVAVYLTRAEPGGHGSMFVFGKEGQLQATSTSEKTVGRHISTGL